MLWVKPKRGAHLVVDHYLSAAVALQSGLVAAKFKRQGADTNPYDADDPRRLIWLYGFDPNDRAFRVKHRPGAPWTAVEVGVLMLGRGVLTQKALAWIIRRSESQVKSKLRALKHTA